MSLSSFDKRLLAEGLAFFEKPRLAVLLDMLGSSEFERVEALAAILRSSSPDEIDEAVEIFERAVARVTREQARADDGREDRTRTERNPRRRAESAAERREERRRSS
ncbi:MAG: hypothetical protein ACRDYV_23210 [Acidimicrobiia bacterium]